MNLAPAVFLSWLGCCTCQVDGFPPPPLPIDKATTPVLPLPAPVDPTPAADVPFSLILKRALLKDLPGELVLNRSQNWGQQATLPSIQGLRLTEVKRNHGNWEKMRIIGRDLPHRLQVNVEHLVFPDKRALLTVRIEVPVDLEYEKIVWQNGLRLFVGHSRGRVRFRSDLFLETTVNRDGNAKLAVGQRPSFRVLEATMAAYGFTTEYVNGVGGDLASISGGNLQRVFHRWQLSLEREMKSKIVTAMAATGTAPELAVGWARLLTAISTDADLAQSMLGPAAFTTPSVREMALVPTNSGTQVCAPILPFTINLLLNGRSPPPHNSFSLENRVHSGSPSGFSIHIGSPHSSDHESHSSSPSHSSHPSHDDHHHR